jgi:FkbM family methyltransferase
MDQQYTGVAVNCPTVFDVGANVGLFTLQQIAEHPEGLTAYVFEPDPETVTRLRRNLQQYMGPRWKMHVFNSACGAETGVLPFVRFQSTNSHFAESDDTSDTISVSVFKLDEIVRDNSVPQIDLLKIDVEGAELSVLKGAEQFALPMTRHLTLEYHGDENRDAVSCFLSKRGFELVSENRLKSILSFLASRDSPMLSTQSNCSLLLPEGK